MSGDGALRTLESKKLRVGRIAEFNDPFEWRMGVVGFIPSAENIVRGCMDQYLHDWNEAMGIISFSDTPAESVLWAHYADHHRGICLEFEIPDGNEHLHRMQYTNDRPIFDLNWLHDADGGDSKIRPVIQQLLTRKSLGWSYEREYRGIFDLDSCEIIGGSYFRRIPPGYLKRVILGFRSSVSERYVVRLLSHSESGHVPVCRAKEQAGSYLVQC